MSRTTSDVVIVSQSMERVREVAQRAAGTSAPILILGETGTGKEVLARTIHGASSRAGREMANVNCAAIPSTLIESTLFGHVRGAFSGALRSAKGLFQEAHGSTLLLDEVGELSPCAQAALLRVLDTKRVMPVGSTRESEVDVRVIAATHRDLKAMVAGGAFRSDLLYRLNAVTIELPPLRDRPEEIVPLARLFVRQAAQAWGVPAKELGPTTEECLLRHPWPGNVRELRNAVERALLMSTDTVIRPPDLPIADRSPDDGPGPSDGGPDFRSRIATYEMRLIEEALKVTRGHKTRAAALLRMPIRTLSHKIKAYGLERAADGLGT